MKTSHKIVGIVLCGVVLAIGPSNAVQAEHSPGASDVMKTDSVTEGEKYNFQSDDDKQQTVKTKRSSAQGAKTIKGELLRVDNAHYFVKDKDGTEVQLHTDKTTKMKGKIRKGDQVKATVNDQNHALSIQVTK